MLSFTNNFIVLSVNILSDVTLNVVAYLHDAALRIMAMHSHNRVLVCQFEQHTSSLRLKKVFFSSNFSIVLSNIKKEVCEVNTHR
jgi:hypothetical protein